MSNETAHCSGQIVSLICFRVIILNWMHVMKWLRGLKHIYKVTYNISPGDYKGVCKEHLFPLSVVSLDSTALISEEIAASWVLGIFPSTLYSGLIEMQ